MSTSADQLAFTLDALRPGRIRREPRRDTVRIVEYTRFPRVGPDRGPRIGFTRDISASGMCIGTEEPESVGALLRVEGLHEAQSLVLLRLHDDRAFVFAAGGVYRLRPHEDRRHDDLIAGDEIVDDVFVVFKSVD